MGEPAPARLVELGPGRGTLMADAIRALKVVPGFLSGATVHLVETSKALQDSQRAALAQAPVRICWHDDLRDVPDGPTLFIANEFFDCLPVQQFVFDGSIGAWRERMVGPDGDGFQFAPGAIVETPPALNPAAATEIEDGAILERRPAVGDIIDAFAARSPLAALIIDYGYSRPSIGDTVQAVRAHRFAALFDKPGESDITAHVDFLQLRQAAERAKMKTFGPMPMGEWLLRLGLEARVKQLLGYASEGEANEMKGCVARLVDPAQMGVLFKVLALTNGIAMSPPPFE